MKTISIVLETHDTVFKFGSKREVYMSLARNTRTVALFHAWAALMPQLTKPQGVVLVRITTFVNLCLCEGFVQKNQSILGQVNSMRGFVFAATAHLLCIKLFFWWCSEIIYELLPSFQIFFVTQNKSMNRQCNQRNIIRNRLCNII